jgi:hypothetical protein
MFSQGRDVPAAELPRARPFLLNRNLQKNN